MLRLLLSKEKKELRAEYTLRWGMVFLGSLSIVVLAWGFSLLPTFVSLQSEETVLKENIRVATDTALNKDRDQLKQELQVVNKQLQLLNVPEYQVSALLQQITSAQTNSLALSTILFASVVSDIDQSVQGIVTLSGVADRRSDLIAYADALKKQKTLFSAVDLPFASLVKDADIPFTITITLVPVLPNNN